MSRAPVAHACNLSYSGGRDQEDHCSKPAQANSSWDPISKKTHHKQAQDVGPQFKPLYCKKKKRRRWIFKGHNYQMQCPQGSLEGNYFKCRFMITSPSSTSSSYSRKEKASDSYIVGLLSFEKLWRDWE
jgi:hypothetical protein